MLGFLFLFRLLVDGSIMGSKQTNIQKTLSCHFELPDYLNDVHMGVFPIATLYPTQI